MDENLFPIHSGAILMEEFVEAMAPSGTLSRHKRAVLDQRAVSL